MEAADKLLTLEHRPLEVFKSIDGEICVTYKDSWVKDGLQLKGSFGTGKTFEKACEDYLNYISGKTLVFCDFDGSRTCMRDVFSGISRN